MTAVGQLEKLRSHHIRSLRIWFGAPMFAAAKGKGPLSLHHSRFFMRPVPIAFDVEILDAPLSGGNGRNVSAERSRRPEGLHRFLFVQSCTTSRCRLRHSDNPKQAS